jgi:hypothetical protein
MRVNKLLGVVLVFALAMVVGVQVGWELLQTWQEPSQERVQTLCLGQVPCNTTTPFVTKQCCTYDRASTKCKYQPNFNCSPPGKGLVCQMGQIVYQTCVPANCIAIPPGTKYDTSYTCSTMQKTASFNACKVTGTIGVCGYGDDEFGEYCEYDVLAANAVGNTPLCITICNSGSTTCVKSYLACQ